jgi:hypothetical protein
MPVVITTDYPIEFKSFATKIFTIHSSMFPLLLVTTLCEDCDASGENVRASYFIHSIEKFVCDSHLDIRMEEK